MTWTQRITIMGAAAVVPGLLPGWLASHNLFALPYAIGVGLPALAIGGIALFAGRSRPDGAAALAAVAAFVVACFFAWTVLR